MLVPVAESQNKFLSEIFPQQILSFNIVTLKKNLKIYCLKSEDIILYTL